MDDLISRQAAIDAIDRERKNKHLFNTAEDGLLEARGVINTLPSVEPERKTGEWLVTESIQDGQITWLNYKCSKCGHHRDRKMNYCEVCGAKMEKK